MYEAFMIYASVVNETISEGGNLRDGRTITHKLWNREFVGIHISKLSIVLTKTK